MKLIPKILSLGFVLGMLALVACEEQRILFEEADYLRFSDSTIVVKESLGKPIEVKVHVVGKPLNQAVTVNYSVSGDAREGRDYTINGTKGVVTIPAGKLFGIIDVRLINNANNILESQDIIFELTGTSSGPELLLGQAGGKLGKQFRLTIQDDCLLSGFYTGSIAAANNQRFEVADIEVSSQDCKTYTVAKWNVGIFDFNAIREPLNFIDNGNNTLTIPKQVSNYIEVPYDTLQGNGIFDPRTKSIILNVKIKLPISETRDSVFTFPITYLPRKQ